MNDNWRNDNWGRGSWWSGGWDQSPQQWPHTTAVAESNVPPLQSRAVTFASSEQNNDDALASSIETTESFEILGSLGSPRQQAAAGGGSSLDHAVQEVARDEAGAGSMILHSYMHEHETAVAENTGAVDEHETAVAENTGAVAGDEAGAGSAQIMPANETAVVVCEILNAGVAGERAVEVAPRQVFDVAFFNGLEVDSTNYKRHNVALKWFRDSLEAKGIFSKEFMNEEVYQISAIVHEKGPLYHFDDNIKTPWKWQDMVAQLDAPSLQLVCAGLPGSSYGRETTDRSRGIVSCRIDRTDVYDHKRHCAMKANPPKEMMKIWDFVVVCEDGTEVWLHPNYSSRRVEAYKHTPPQDHEIPASGLGGTSGPGTFKYFKNKRVECTVKFKTPPGGKGNGKGKANP